MDGWTAGETVHFPNGRWELALRSALRSTSAGRTELALPYCAETAFPLPELFCFARLACLNGKSYIVFAFDRCKMPVF